MAAKFTVYQDAKSDWRWLLRAKNGAVIARGFEGYASRQDCLNSIESMKANAPDAEVVQV